MLKFMRRLWCRLGQHEGYVDGGFHCDFCPFEIPYEDNIPYGAGRVDRLASGEIDDILAIYNPELRRRQP